MSEKDCEWLLREGHYIQNDDGYMEKIGEKDKVYCMYTCTETAQTRKPKTDDNNSNFSTYEKILKSDMSCCPHLSEINNSCPIIENARVLEACFQARRMKKNSI